MCVDTYFIFSTFGLCCSKSNLQGLWVLVSNLVLKFVHFNNLKPLRWIYDAVYNFCMCPHHTIFLHLTFLHWIFHSKILSCWLPFHQRHALWVNTAYFKIFQITLLAFILSFLMFRNMQPSANYKYSCF